MTPFKKSIIIDNRYRINTLGWRLIYGNKNGKMEGIKAETGSEALRLRQIYDGLYVCHGLDKR